MGQFCATQVDLCGPARWVDPYPVVFPGELTHWSFQVR